MYMQLKHVDMGVCKGWINAGSLQDSESGFQFDVRFQKPVLAATLSYFFKFQEGYDLTAGAKMPGICSEGMPSLVQECVQLCMQECVCLLLHGVGQFFCTAPWADTHGFVLRKDWQCLIGQ
jgi:hypothetical protein